MKVRRDDAVVTATLKYAFTLGVAAMEGRGFYYPVDIGLGANGRLYVLGRSHEGDTRGIQVCMMDVDSEFYGTFGSVGQADGQFIWTTAVAVDSDGLVYVSDEHLNRISVFDGNGKFLRKWGTPGSRPGQLDGPSGMSLDSEDHIWIADHRNHRIQRFTRDGDFITQFGSQGRGDGKLHLPWGITVAPSGDMYVADWGNDRIQRFTEDGDFVAAYGERGQGDGQFRRPSGVAVDDDGYIYVADWGNNRIQLLDPEGAFAALARGEATLSPWAHDFLESNIEERDARAVSNLEPDLEFLGGDVNEESYHTEKLFWAPVSVRLDEPGNAYVVDRNRHRIQVYRRSGGETKANGGDGKW